MQRAGSFVGIVSVLIMLSACRNSYVITGDVDAYGYEGHNVSLVQFSQEGVQIIDSALVTHGRFIMKGTVDSIVFVMLCSNGMPVIPMYLEGGKTRIGITPTDMYASGTRQNDLLFSFLKSKKEVDNRYDEMQQRQQQIVQSGVIDQKELDMVHDSLRCIIGECEDLIFDFISTNCNEVAALGVFSMITAAPGNQTFPLIRRILDDAPDTFFDNQVVAQYVERTGYSR